MVVAGMGGSRKGREGERWGGGEGEGGMDRESRIPGRLNQGVTHT